MRFLFYNYYMLEKVRANLKSGEEYRIVFLGDSITSTEWVHPNFREIIEYVLKFGDLSEELGDWKLPEWGLRFINCGFDGSTTDDIITMLDQRVIINKPDLVIFMFGRNDYDFGFSVEKHKANTKLILEKLSKTVSDTVYLSTIACFDDKINNLYEPFVHAEKELFPMKNVRFVDLFNLYKQVPYKEFFTFLHDEFDLGTIIGSQDIDHPGVRGNAYIAKILLKEIFGIEFDPEIYLKDVASGRKSPRY